MNAKELLKTFISDGKLSESELLYVLKIMKFETELRFRKKIQNNEIVEEDNEEQILLIETFLNSLND
ncbi:MAG: hypothetical protein SLAVMIC_00720 [uncultured marine phage]|uniref:Uncharacterized protein n=1 Tax=uncultured marine phage TaxID=707152 RepID=A0A8D9FSD3_9VIRU|nr:MAG: hypothetical protein SLAVMIC_00720 [uncultured marine phage]